MPESTQTLDDLRRRYLAAGPGEKARLAARMLEQAESASSPIGITGTIQIRRLDLPAIVRLVLGPGQPLIELARAGGVEGWECPGRFLQTEIHSASGASYDLSNQFEHSFYLQSPEGLAGCILINHSGSESYDRLVAVAPAFQRQGLGRLLLSLHAWNARECAIERLKHKVSKDRPNMLNLCRSLGYDTEREDPDAPGYLFVEAATEAVWPAAREALAAAGMESI